MSPYTAPSRWQMPEFTPSDPQSNPAPRTEPRRGRRSADGRGYAKRHRILARYSPSAGLTLPERAYLSSGMTLFRSCASMPSVAARFPRQRPLLQRPPPGHQMPHARVSDTSVAWSMAQCGMFFAGGKFRYCVCQMFINTISPPLDGYSHRRHSLNWLAVFPDAG